MKLMTLYIFFITSLSLMASESDILLKYQQTYQSSAHKIAEKLSSEMALNCQLAFEELKKVERAYQNAGKLEELMATKELLKQDDPQTLLTKTSPLPPIALILKKLNQANQLSKRNYEVKLNKLKDSYTKALERLVKILTQKNQIEDAIAIQEEVDQFKSSHTVNAPEKPKTTPIVKPFTPKKNQVSKSSGEPSEIFLELNDFLLKKAVCSRLEVDKQIAKVLWAGDKGKTWCATWKGAKGKVLVWGHPAMALQEAYLKKQLAWFSPKGGHLWCSNKAQIANIKKKVSSKYRIKLDLPFSKASVKAGDTFIIAPKTALSATDISFIQDKIAKGSNLLIYLTGWVQKDIQNHPFNKLLSPYGIQFTKNATERTGSLSLYNEAGTVLKKIPIIRQ